MKPEEEYTENQLAATVLKLSNIIILLIAFIIGLLILLAIYIPAPAAEKVVETPVADKDGLFTDAAKNQSSKQNEANLYWQAPSESELDGDALKEKILYGKELIVHTAEFFGPQGKVIKASTNGMNCQNCHLEAGTKVYGNNYALVASTYPKYRARSGSIENIYKRVNDCFERSLNGKAIDTNSTEMQAIVAYMNWIGKGVTKETIREGAGLKELAVLDRAADPEKGKSVYSQKCQSCHQANGEGQINGDKTAYTYPPVWGNNSYNIGAGLYRLSNFARYVKNNMPLGASHTSTQLSDEEAWDVSAFVNSQEHPSVNIKKDWPNIAEKPFDHPFGPFADGFSEAQHKFGPFQPIKDKLKALKKTSKT
jgi:thiosulfate dehydrogenase